MKREWIVGLCVIVIAIAGVSFGAYSFSSDLAAQSDKIISDKSFIDQQNSIVSQLAVLKNDASTTMPYLAAMQKLLPSHDSLIGFPDWVTGVGLSHSVAATAAFTGVNAPTTANVPASDGFTITASGSAANLVAFLKDAETESSGFLIAVDTFDLVSNANGYTLTAHGRVFSRG